MSGLLDEKQLKSAFNEMKESDGKVPINKFTEILVSHGLDVKKDRIVVKALATLKEDMDDAALTLFVKNLEAELDRSVELDTNKRKIFDMIDADKNGFLDRYEVKMAFAMLNQPFTDADVEELMSEADTDKDGRISFDEFKNSRASEKFSVDIFSM